MRRIAVVMAGGTGERFWPLSTAQKPKQLLDLTGCGKCLLDEAIERVQSVTDDVFVSTSAALGPSIAESGIAAGDHILQEPIRRNTLGALIWSMAMLQRRERDDFLVAVVTADHRIAPAEEFAQSVTRALDLANETEGLVTMGIQPDRPETGYGYLQTTPGSTKLARFAEKPDLETAQRWLAEGTWLWNSGMFYWRASAFERELAAINPLFAQTLAQVREGNDSALEALPSESIDKAVMEKSANVHTIPARFEWDDVGSWDSLRRLVPLDENGNAVAGKATLVDCRDCVVYAVGATSPPSLLGLNGVTVVCAGAELAIFPAARSQDVRILAQLAANRT